eukprot:jgi/Chlat1/7664/Chrsp64S07131
MPAAAPSPAELRSMFRAFMRTARRFSNYNIREYVRRRAREDFREKGASPEELSRRFEQGKSDLAVAQRQSIIYHLYAGKRSVMELQPRIQPLKRASEQPSDAAGMA